MKSILRFILTVSCASLILSCGVQTHTDTCANQQDVTTVTEFYDSYIRDYLGEDTAMIQKFINQGIESLDSCFLIHYNLPINGYNIRMRVLPLSEINDNVACRALIILANGDKTIALDSLTVHLSDSIFKTLRKHQINQINYNLNKSSCHKGLKYPNLGEYQQMPFFFFDTDFDGEKEFVVRVPGVGQRSFSCYYSLKLNWNMCEWESADKMLYDNEDIDKRFYPFDDMTQFDYTNQVFILYRSAGHWDNEWDYYKVENGECKLVKKIVEYDPEDPKVKRITYQDNDSVVTCIATGKDHSYSID